MNKTHFSDILRCALLTRHGGIWADVTCYSAQPLAPLFQATRHRFFAYTRADVYLLSSWFILSARHNITPKNAARCAIRILGDGRAARLQRPGRRVVWRFHAMTRKWRPFLAPRRSRSCHTRSRSPRRGTIGIGSVRTCARLRVPTLARACFGRHALGKPQPGSACMPSMGVTSPYSYVISRTF